MKTILIRILLMIMMICLYIHGCSGGNDTNDPNEPDNIIFVDVTLAWDENKDHVDGYKIYYSTESFSDHTYNTDSYDDFCEDVGDVTTYRVERLESHVTWFFVVTAYSSYKNESKYSNEVKKMANVL